MLDDIQFKQKVKVVRMHGVKGVGDRTLFKLLNEFQDIDRVYHHVIRGLGKEPVYSDFKATEIVKKAEGQGIDFLTCISSSYPLLLKQIFDPPPILYSRGELNLLAENTRSLGVVGTRRYTEYGEKVVNHIIPMLVSKGIVIVSGMALGVDSIAHRCCLLNGGKTIAVLGSGVDIASPAQNRSLYEKIITKGLVISEFPLGMEAAKYTFPQRNRVISGLSLGVLIVEAGTKSGSLITADYAMEQSRDVFAVPGEIFSHASEGTNHLITQGAVPIIGAEGILEVFNMEESARVRPNIEFSSDLESRIYKLLETTPLEIDVIIDQLEEPTENIMSVLSQLEIKGFITRFGHDTYKSV